MRNVVFSLTIAALFTGCMGPYKVELFEEIGANETAFVIPLEGETEKGQAKLQSVDYLEKNKVVAKRISLPQREKNLGRTYGNFEWIPTVKVIKVDRTPVTREWTHSGHTTAASNQEAIAVESKDSINFWVGVNITVSIEEEDAAKFLYHYAGKKLEDIVDKNVRGYVQSILSREFGKKVLQECMDEKADVFDICLTETRTYFEQKGVTIDYLGSSEGLAFENKAIQDAINNRFVAQNMIEVAEHEKLAQDKRNEALLAKAKAEREAAEEIGKAQEAMMVKVDLEVKKINAEAQKTAAEKWNGSVPSMILPQGSNFLFGMDAPQKVSIK